MSNILYGQDISEQFLDLEKQLGFSDYQIHFESKIFTLKDFHFSILDLKQLFLNETKNNPSIEGALEPIHLSLAQEEINNFLRLTTNINEQQSDGLLYLINENEWDQRKKRFWDIINPYIDEHTICFKHLPEEGSYFGDFLYWSFNYILLKGKLGIFIHACAWD